MGFLSELIDGISQLEKETLQEYSHSHFNLVVTYNFFIFVKCWLYQKVGKI